jgi:hypothetical protein
MDAEGVIDSYVHDVARRLPRDRRNDVAYELRALLTDELRSRAAEERAAEEHTAGAGRAAREGAAGGGGAAGEDSAKDEDCAAGASRDPDAVLALEVVRGFGRPAEIAARYHRPFTILEPGDTWGFVVAALAGGALAGLLSSPPPGEAGAPGAAAQRSATATLAWLGLLVLLFAAKNLVLRRRPDAFAWRPRPVRDRNTAGRAGNAAIAAALAAFLVLYLAPGPVVEAVTGGRVAAADLRYTDSFSSPLRMPWLVGLLAVLIGLQLYVVVRGRWRPAVRWARILVTVSTGTQLGWHTRYGSVFENPDAERTGLWVAASVADVLMVLAGAELYREYTRVDPAPAPEPRRDHVTA